MFSLRLPNVSPAKCFMGLKTKWQTSSHNENVKAWVMKDLKHWNFRICPELLPWAVTLGKGAHHQFYFISFLLFFFLRAQKCWPPFFESAREKTESELVSWESIQSKTMWRFDCGFRRSPTPSACDSSLLQHGIVIRLSDVTAEKATKLGNTCVPLCKVSPHSFLTVFLILHNRLTWQQYDSKTLNLKKKKRSLTLNHLLTAQNKTSQTNSVPGQGTLLTLNYTLNHVNVSVTAKTLFPVMSFNNIFVKTKKKGKNDMNILH